MNEKLKFSPERAGVTLAIGLLGIGGLAIAFLPTMFIREYDTIQDMVTRGAASGVYQTVSVRGYHTPNDGGGGMFTITNTASGTNIGTRVFSGTPGRSWERVTNDEPLTPLMFGARRDGTSDDTMAIQAALTAGSGRTVLLPRGSYKIASALLIDAHNIKVTGQVKIIGPAATEGVIIKGTNVTISGITFDGNHLTERGFLWMNGASGTMEKCRIHNIKETTATITVAAIRILGDTDVTIKDCHVDGVDGSFSSQIARGIHISATSTERTPKRILIEGGSVTNITPPEDGDCIVIQNTWSTNVNVTIDGVYMANAKRGVKIMSPGVRVLNSVMENHSYASISVYAGNTEVSHNKLMNWTGTHGLEIGTPTWTTTNITATFNIIQPDPNGLEGSDGVRIMSTNISNLNLSDNTIINPTRFGIFNSAGMHYSRIDRNIIRRAASNGIMIDDYLEIYYPSTLTLNGNIIHDQSKYGIRVADGTNISVFNTIESGQTGWQLVTADPSVQGFTSKNNGGVSISFRPD